MSARTTVRWALITVSWILCVARSAQGQKKSEPPPPSGTNMVDMKFAPVPGLPTCVTGTVENGDPTDGNSILLAKVSAGCSIPWHYHKANEHLMIVSGTVRLEEKDGKPVVLRDGGFARMQGKHIHQFRCTAACVLFVYSDKTFDIHYVDAQGKEIKPDSALKIVKEKAAPAPKT